MSQAIKQEVKCSDSMTDDLIMAVEEFPVLYDVSRESNIKYIEDPQDLSELKFEISLDYIVYRILILKYVYKFIDLTIYCVLTSLDVQKSVYYEQTSGRRCCK